ncbi:hypothetical protein MIDIC_50047 [Alphaproteobacteria bacterium]
MLIFVMYIQSLKNAYIVQCHPVYVYLQIAEVHVLKSKNLYKYCAQKCSTILDILL